MNIKALLITIGVVALLMVLVAGITALFIFFPVVGLIILMGLIFFILGHPLYSDLKDKV